MSEGIIVIKKGREKPILQQHPWIFSGAIEAVRGDPTPGDIVTVTDHKGAFLARGYWNPKSQIQVRILTWQDEPINDDWWRRMLKRAIDARANEIRDIPYPLGRRLVNAENDYLPGLIVDQYGEWLVIQALTLGIDARKQVIAQILPQICNSHLREIKGIYERSDVEVRGKEGLTKHTGLLWGNEPPRYIEISDYGLLGSTNPEYLVDVRKGHKTGFYLDQRMNRVVLQWLLETASFRSSSGDVFLLNLFSYTGAFGLGANNPNQLADQAYIHIVNVDASREILELGEEIYKLNKFPPENVDFIQADVFDYLHDQVAEGAQYDVIVCDPPKFAHNAGQVERAARGYKDLNLNCFKLVKPGGYLMTFSCSGAIDADLFQKIVFGALADSRRQAQIVKHLTQAEDHPVALTFPEGAYLKGLLLRVY